MVMNGELGWMEIYKDWQYMRSVHEQAQHALDNAMQAFLESGGTPPNRQLLGKVRDLAEQLQAKRQTVDDFITAHSSSGQVSHASLPGPDASLDKS